MDICLFNYEHIIIRYFGSYKNVPRRNPMRMGLGTSREVLNTHDGNSWLQRLLTAAWLATVHAILSHIIKSTIWKFCNSKIEKHFLWKLLCSLRTSRLLRTSSIPSHLYKFFKGSSQNTKHLTINTKLISCHSPCKRCQKASHEIVN